MFTSSTTIYVALVTLLILSVLMYVLSRSIGCCNGKNMFSLFGKSCKGHWKTRSIGEQCGLDKCTGENKPYEGCIPGLCTKLSEKGAKWCKKAKCITSEDTTVGKTTPCTGTGTDIITDITSCFKEAGCKWVEEDKKSWSRYGRLVSTCILNITQV